MNEGINCGDRFTYLVIGVGLILIGYSCFQTPWDTQLVFPYCLLLSFTVGYRLVRVRLPQGPFMTFTPLPIFVSMFLMGPAPASVLIGLGILLTPLLGIYTRSACFNASQFALSIYAGYGVYALLGGEIPVSYLNGTVFLNMAAATLAFMTVNVTLIYASELLSTPHKLQRVFRNLYWEMMIWSLSFPLSILVLSYKIQLGLDLTRAIVALAPLLAFCYLVNRIVENHVIGIQLSQLTDFITGLSAPLNQEEILRRFFAGLERVVDYDRCAIWVKTPEDGYGLLEYQPVLPEIDPLAMTELYLKAIEKGHAMGRLSGTRRPARLFQPVPTRYLLAPMIYGDEVRGILQIEEQSSQLYSETDQKFFALVAENLAVALEHATTVHELENTKEHLLNILTNSHIAVVVTDQRNRVQIFNEGAIQLSGYREEEMMGDRIARCFHPDDFRKIRALLLRKGKIEDLETEIITAEGDLLPISLSASVLRDNAGRIVGSLAVCYSIAQRKLLQKQLVQNEKLAALGHLITGVTHEINNRLQPILGFTQLLQRSDLREDQRDPVMAIEKSAQGARAIVQSLLNFSRPGQAKLEPGDLNETLRDSLQLLDIDRKRFSIHLQFDPTLPATEFDRHQIEQVMLNLLKNALQAMERKGGRIWIKTCYEDDKIWVRVRDDGPGMSEKLISRVFDPFFTTKTVGQGVGLGLSLCYGIIQAHGGAIQIQSRSGRGAEVSFWIPFHKCRLPAVEVLEPVKMSDQAIPAGGRIFIVDDEEGIRNLLQDILSEDYEVSLFDSGLGAMEAMKREPFDLCVCDLRMPEVDGIDLYHWVCREMPEHRDDFIFITGDTFGPAAQSFLESARQKYLCKPFTVQQIESLVQEHFLAHPPSCPAMG